MAVAMIQASIAYIAHLMGIRVQENTQTQHVSGHTRTRGLSKNICRKDELCISMPVDASDGRVTHLTCISIRRWPHYECSLFGQPCVAKSIYTECCRLARGDIPTLSKEVH